MVSGYIILDDDKDCKIGLSLRLKALNLRLRV